MDKKIKLLVITGISGAGKTTVLDLAEDLGYYAMDNIPPSLIGNFIELYADSNNRSNKLAVVVDIRTQEFIGNFFDDLKRLEDKNIETKVIFLDADNETVIKRYKEHRRPHPLSHDGNILNAIKEEKEKLEFIKDKSDYYIDTSRLTTHELRNQVEKLLNAGINRSSQLSIISFGFKNGILLDADFVFDLRFLKNPYYNEELRPKTGLDSKVRDYVFSDSETENYLSRLIDFIGYVFSEFEEVGKREVTIGIGCTGGKHRSVVISEELAKRFEEMGINVVVSHRDIKVE